MQLNPNFRRLEDVREALELDQGDFALAAGVQPNAYSNWGKRKTGPSVPSAEKFCNQYGLTLDYIYRGTLSGLPHDLAVKLRKAA